MTTFFSMKARTARLVALSLATFALCSGSARASIGPSLTKPLFKDAVFSSSQLTRHVDVAYSQRPNGDDRHQYTSDLRKASEIGSETLTLTMDIWVPPSATTSRPMPLALFVHGGGLKYGGKEGPAASAISYARTGYVAASINYRLTARNDTSATRRQTAVTQATEDLMNAVRFLKANAATYRLDPDRIAVMGSSAGGALTLINAVEPDTLEGTVSDYPGISSRVRSVVTTGATLDDPLVDTDAFIHFDAADTPGLLFHATSVDGSTGRTWDVSLMQRTCDRFNGAGSSCTPVQAPLDCAYGMSKCHTVSLAATTPYWSTVIQPFLFGELVLAGI